MPPVNWDEPWEPFRPGTLPTIEDDMDRDRLIGIAINNKYQVNIYAVGVGEPFGRVVWLSIKARDKSPRHDWRDLQRIKNEVCGEEFQAIEIYPKEEHHVDTSNQYHLWVFLDGYEMPFGFFERCLMDGSFDGSVQRPWPEGERPADCLDDATAQARIAEFRTKQRARVYDGNLRAKGAV